MQAYNGHNSTIIIPEGVKAICGAFLLYGEDIDCAEIYIPESVERIGLLSFSTECNAKVFIPDSVTDMRILATGEDQGCFGLHSTIVTTEGSYAEEYAKRFDIYYEIVDKIEYPENAEWCKCEKNDN